MTRLVVLFVSLWSSLVLLGCKQADGEFCQVNEDCADGLVCIAGTQRCGKRSTQIVDAGPIDASLDAAACDDCDAQVEPDAAPPDASFVPDAMTIVPDAS